VRKKTSIAVINVKLLLLIIQNLMELNKNSHYTESILLFFLKNIKPDRKIEQKVDSSVLNNFFCIFYDPLPIININKILQFFRNFKVRNIKVEATVK